MWDEHWVDGGIDPDFPPLDSLDDDDESAPAPIDQISESEKQLFRALRESLSSRFRWPSTLCQFCIGEADRGRLKTLPNRFLGFAEEDFEMCLWQWAAMPTWARSSFLDHNHSRIGVIQ
jgi:hypothetical protein